MSADEATEVNEWREKQKREKKKHTRTKRNAALFEKNVGHGSGMRVNDRKKIRTTAKIIVQNKELMA